jgi:acetyltransferase-like isoleucine patch superfamily enzyme
MPLRLCLALLIAILPVNRLRLFCYRRLLGYEIGAGSRVGPLNLIACRSFRLGAGATVGRLNVFRGAFVFSAGPRLFVGHGNVFACPDRLDDPKLADRGYARAIAFGADCLVNDGHFLDAHGRIAVGDGTWIAGRDSQFYTHGASARDRDIAIGGGCFIGSAVRFAPGSSIGDACIVGIGSVVVGRIDEDEALIAGFPACVLRGIAEERAAGRFAFSKADWAA